MRLKYQLTLTSLTALAFLAALVAAMPVAAQDFGRIEEAERAFRGPSYSP